MIDSDRDRQRENYQTEDGREGGGTDAVQLAQDPYGAGDAELSGVRGGGDLGGRGREGGG